MRSLSAPGLSTIALWLPQRRRFAQPKPSAEEPRQQSSGWDVARLAQRKAAESEAGAFTWQVLEPLPLSLLGPLLGSWLRP